MMKEKLDADETVETVCEQAKGCERKRGASVRGMSWGLLWEGGYFLRGVLGWEGEKDGV